MKPSVVRTRSAAVLIKAMDRFVRTKGCPRYVALAYKAWKEDEG